jgi:hypothetical protein
MMPSRCQFTADVKLEGRCISVDPFAIPTSIVLAYGNRLRAFAVGLARFRPKYTDLLGSSLSVWFVPLASFTVAYRIATKNISSGG